MEREDFGKPYQIARPLRLTSPVLFASPHSGREYPRDMVERTVLDRLRLRSSEDAFVDDLLASVPGQGAVLIAAQVPRAYVDLNRAEGELDPALIEGVARAHLSPRVLAGLGVIPRVVSGGRQIYSGKISRAEAEARLECCWRPYHAALSSLIRELRGTFGRAILLDMHSMPSEAVEQAGVGRADIVLGDRFGASASRATSDRVAAAFTRAGLRVARNAPFAGAYMTQRYGRPGEKVEVVQVEIDRGLYMDEARISPSPRFADFARLMGQVVADLARIGGAEERPLAAE